MMARLNINMIVLLLQGNGITISYRLEDNAESYIYNERKVFMYEVRNIKHLLCNGHSGTVTCFCSVHLSKRFVFDKKFKGDYI